MTDTRIPEAIKFWNNLESIKEMAIQWANNPWKAHHEDLISKWVGEADSVADLGCGPGRYSLKLLGQYDIYQGFDGSLAMLDLAKESNPEVSFSCVDIFNFSPDETFDLVLMIDVAQHQLDPLNCIERMLKLWRAKRYIFSLITAREGEELLLTTIVPQSKFDEFIKTLNIKQLYSEPYDGEEKFTWNLVEL